MSYDNALNILHELADHAGLRIKTYCLVRFKVLTVPEAVAIIQQLLP